MSNAWMCFFLPSITFNDTHSAIKQVKMVRLWLKVWKFCFQGVVHCPSNQQVSMAESFAFLKWYIVMSLVASLVAIGGSPSARVHQKSDLLRAPNCRTVQSAIWASCLLLCSTSVLQLMPLCEHMGATVVGAFDGSRQRAPMYNLANTYTLRTDAHCALANTLTGTEWRHCLYR